MFFFVFSSVEKQCWVCFPVNKTKKLNVNFENRFHVFPLGMCVFILSIRKKRPRDLSRSLEPAVECDDLFSLRQFIWTNYSAMPKPFINGKTMFLPAKLLVARNEPHEKSSHETPATHQIDSLVDKQKKVKSMQNFKQRELPWEFCANVINTRWIYGCAGFCAAGECASETCVASFWYTIRKLIIASNQ